MGEYVNQAFGKVAARRVLLADYDIRFMPGNVHHPFAMVAIWEAQFVASVGAYRAIFLVRRRSSPNAGFGSQLLVVDVRSIPVAQCIETHAV